MMACDGITASSIKDRAGNDVCHRAVVLDHIHIHRDEIPYYMGRIASQCKSLEKNCRHDNGASDVYNDTSVSKACY